MLDSISTTQIKLSVVIAKPMQLSLVGCFLGSLLCGVATEVMSFNVGRMVQAFSAGLALLSSQIWIGDHSKNNWLLILEAAGHEHRAYSRIPIYRENPDFITGYVLK